MATKITPTVKNSSGTNDDYPQEEEKFDPLPGAYGDEDYQEGASWH